MSIILKSIKKYFDGKIVLQNINLTIEAGAIYCLLGKNGAGKTTLINILTDYISPNYGEVVIDGFTYEENSKVIKRKIGLESKAILLLKN